MSLFSLLTAGLACMVPFAAAYTTPVGPDPKGNPITQPGLNSIVPVGEGFTITWQPTTEGPVTLVLLKGPATDLKLETVIVEGTENDGSYVWTPSTSLEPTADATGYGIQLIVDSGPNKGQYQYTTQFGISNPEYAKKENAPSSSSSASSSIATAPTYDHSAAPLKTASSSGYPSFYSAPAVIYPTASANATATPTGYAVPTGHATHNSTGYYHPSTTLQTSSAAASGSPAPTEPIVYPGAASTMSISIFSLVLAAGVAVLAY